MNTVRGSTIGNRHHQRPPSLTEGGTNYSHSRQTNRHARAPDNPTNGRAAPPDDEPPLSVLSFYESGSSISFAAYLEDTNEILFQDATAHSGHDTEHIIHGVLLETRPNLILVGSKVLANGPLLDCLTTMPDLGDQGVIIQPQNTLENDTAVSSSIPYQLLKSAAFEPRACRTIILEKLRVLTLMHRQTVEHDVCPHNSRSNYHSLASIINFDSNTLIRALGSLLIHLRSTAFRLEEGYTVTVNDIRRCSGHDSYLRLEDTAMRALRIFATDFHPLQASVSVKGKSYSKSKEGFSIYTLLDRTKSRAGKERLRQWMMQPLRDANKIRGRHTAMELFLHPNSHGSASLLLEQLAKVGNMDAILLRMQRCSTNVGDFLMLGRMLEAAYEIVATLGGEVREKAYQIDREEGSADNDVQKYPSVAFLDELLGRCHADTLRNLRERLACIIDEEVTAEVKDHVVIHFGFHEELDRAKETFETLDGECLA